MQGSTPWGPTGEYPLCLISSWKGSWCTRVQAPPPQLQSRRGNAQQTASRQSNTVTGPASITVMQPAFTRRNRGQHPGGVLKRRWRNGKRTRFLPGLVGVRLPGGVRKRSCSVGVADISPGPQPGECRFDPGTEHARPYRPMARLPAFQAGEDGSEPSGVTARSSNGKTPVS